MLVSTITRDQAYELLTKYNKEPFHIQHALTVEGVMRWYAGELGHSDEADFWAICPTPRKSLRSGGWICC